MRTSIESGRAAASRRPKFRKAAIRRSAGMTLLEMTVVIFGLLLMATILLTMFRAWKKGSDRAMCIVNLQAVQKGVRGLANMNGATEGQLIAGLEGQVVGPNAFFEELPICPGEGAYTLGGDEIPAIGDLYMQCSLKDSEDHLPKDITGW